MVSQKKSDLKHCIKCQVELNKNNWLSYLEKRSNYICTPCFRNYGKTHYKQDPDYSKKQLARYRSRKSAIIHSYGDTCVICGEDEYYKLSIHYKNGNLKLTTNQIHDWLYNNQIHKDGYQILCQNCNKKSRSDKYAWRDKITVVQHYGNQCCECKENDIEKLTISHKETRKGSLLYRWIIKNNFPKLDLQIICFNCKHQKIGEFIVEQELES